jgi:uncharacterized protein (TIGR02246 family)
MPKSMATEITALHAALLTAWNNRDAHTMAALFAPNGSQIGFDGSMANGPEEILQHVSPIFRDHPTARFVAKVCEARVLGDDVCLLRAVAGMIPPGEKMIKPEVNAIQTLVARRVGGAWKIELFQNTPAAWHGRSEDVTRLTEELQALA